MSFFGLDPLTTTWIPFNPPDGGPWMREHRVYLQVRCNESNDNVGLDGRGQRVDCFVECPNRDTPILIFGGFHIEDLNNHVYRHFSCVQCKCHLSPWPIVAVTREKERHSASDNTKKMCIDAFLKKRRKRLPSSTN